MESACSALGELRVPRGRGKVNPDPRKSRSPGSSPQSLPGATFLPRANGYAVLVRELAVRGVSASAEWSSGRAGRHPALHLDFTLLPLQRGDGHAEDLPDYGGERKVLSR